MLRCIRNARACRSPPRCRAPDRRRARRSRRPRRRRRRPAARGRRRRHRRRRRPPRPLSRRSPAPPLARCLAGAVVDDELERVGDDGRVTRVRVRAVPVRDGDGAVLAAVAAFADVTAERRRLAAAELLDDAGRVLLESLELARVAQLGAELLVPRLGDVRLVSLLADEDELRLLGLAHADPARLARERPRHDVFPLQDLAWDVLQDSRARLVADLGPLAPRCTSSACAPLSSRR
ncbi:PAS domain-containing protein [Nannocystis pusilla]|uniref:PAS domain-containing protein n=1 Tax=Nannocystis pusilla TaxID=889268 RepID=UPI003B7BA4D5